MQKVKKNIDAKLFDCFIGLGLFCVSLLLLLYRVAEITPGMWGDEVTLGWMVDKLMHLGAYTPFLPDNFGHPTFLVYLSAGIIAVMGRSILSLRLVSLIFGALSVAIFYFFVRLFFSRMYALGGAILLMTSYPFLVVARFAYEMSAALFFFILSAYFLVKLSEKKSSLFALLMGLSCGLGIHTYLAFRTVATLLGGIALIILVGSRKYIHIALFGATIVCITLPLFFYEGAHPGGLNARVQALSVFSQNLSSDEITKELQGAAERTLSMFAMTGDPNPRQNPGNTIPFDLITVGLSVVGLGYLAVKRRGIFVSIVLLFIAILTTEIVTLERIPEFHYYGLGHPNTLRISPLIPLMCFLVLWGLQTCITRFMKGKEEIFWLCIVITLISGINLHTYFGQKPNQWIYSTNFVVPLKIVDALNSSYQGKTIGLSSSLYTNQHIQYFLDHSIKIEQVLVPPICRFTIPHADLTILSASELAHCTQDQLAPILKDSTHSVTPLMNPWGTADAIFIR